MITKQRILAVIVLAPFIFMFAAPALIAIASFFLMLALMSNSNDGVQGPGFWSCLLAAVVCFFLGLGILTWQISLEEKKDVVSPTTQLHDGNQTQRQ